MSGESLPILIGIDGGGSGCRAALVHGAGRQRHEVALGAANVSTDFDGAVAVIRKALDLLAEAAGQPVAALADAPAHLGLAGMLNDATASRVVKALGLTRARVTVDRETTLAGALGGGDGAIAAIGTGSFLGRQSGGRQFLAGGWGFRLGDQASGAWLGRRLLEEVLLAEDGFAGKTDLSRAVLAGFGGAPDAIVRFALTAPPSGFAAHARAIVAVAETGDKLARRLMLEGARYLEHGLTALGWRAGEPLCLTGGVGPTYADYLPEPMRAAVTRPLGSALDGALILAQAIAEERA